MRRTLSAALSALQSGLKALSDGSFSWILTASSSGEGITATTEKRADSGSYSIAVSQIATAQSLVSGAFNARAALATSGTMRFSLGLQSMTVNIDSSNNSLSGIAKAINGGQGNPGVTATVVTGTDGQHLVLNSGSTGAKNGNNIATSNLVGDSGLSSLAVSSTPGIGAGKSVLTSGGTTRTQAAVAQDAEFTIGTVPISSATNVIKNAVSGVSLQLSTAAVGTIQTLKIAQDVASQTSAISTFVSLYNTVITTLGTLTKYTPKAQHQGPLLGDSAANHIANTLASVVATRVKSGSSTYTLAGVGINLQTEGTLSVNSTTLSAALSGNPSGVAALFNSTNGVGANLSTDLTGFIQKNGAIDNEATAASADLDSTQGQAKVLSDYATQLTRQYTAQFHCTEKYHGTDEFQFSVIDAVVRWNE